MPARDGRARRTHGQAVTPDALELVAGDPVRGAQAHEMLAEPRALRPPPSDTEVRVVALREDPRVAARDDPELEDEFPAVLLSHLRVRQVALERHPHVLVATQPERLGADAVCAVRADDDGSLVAIASR